MLFSETFTKQLKRLRFFEPSLAVLGCFVVTVLMICCFFYFNYRYVENGFLHEDQSENVVLVQHNSNMSAEVHKKDDIVKGIDLMGGKNCSDCDIFYGDWVWDESYPLYESSDCRFMDLGFRCSENGRPDLSYSKWRWQPKHCNLPRDCLDLTTKC